MNRLFLLFPFPRRQFWKSDVCGVLGVTLYVAVVVWACH